MLFSNDSALRAPGLGQQLVVPVQHPDQTSVGLQAGQTYAEDQAFPAAQPIAA
jgi:hypothetical protein